MSNTININNATKVIHGRTVLDHVTISLDRGGVYGFVGINGSGKSMLFRAISGLIHLTEGAIDVFGQRVGSDVDFPQNMGLCFESSGFWAEKSGLDNLAYLASIRGVVGQDEAASAMARLGLDPADKRPVSAYSMGMKQRLVIAQAVMERPDLLIMDEPTNALDVEGIATVASIIREERERGTTVLVSSHNEPTVEALFDRTFKMEAGRAREVTSNA